MSSDLPTHFDGSHVRVLGRIRTSRPKLKALPFSSLFPYSAPNLLSSMPDYDRYQSTVPILDQQQVGSCVAHAHTTALMKARDLMGEQFIELSADSLYAQIDGGHDRGADPADAITALQQKGICLLSDVPDKFILESAISAEAWANATRFRIVPAGVYSCASFAELVTADWLGFATTLTINVGNNFDPGSSGIVGFAGGVANHCVSGGEAKKTINGQVAYRFRNSWNTTWGQSGCAWLTAKHIDNQQMAELYAIKWALVDPQDPNLPVPNVA